MCFVCIFKVQTKDENSGELKAEVDVLTTSFDIFAANSKSLDRIQSTGDLVHDTKAWHKKFEFGFQYLIHKHENISTRKHDTKNLNLVFNIWYTNVKVHEHEKYMLNLVSDLDFILYT